jgi:protein-disulfide isomerase
MARNQVRLRVPIGPDDHSQGIPDAAVTLVEYGDYECPHCRRAYPIVKRMQKRLPDRLRFIFRNFPLAEMHPHATAAAATAEAAALQGKFWQMHDMLFENQDALEPGDLLNYAQKLDLDIGRLQAALQDAAVIERVRSDFMGGVRSGVNGTPTFFINESRFDGDWTDMDEFITALQAAAARGT